MRLSIGLGGSADQQIFRREKLASGGTLSRQYHHHRDELWVVLDPGARVEMEDKVIYPEPGEKLYIPHGTVHRLSAGREGPVRVLEVSFGEFDEDDIVRLKDVYGRAEADARNRGGGTAGRG